MKICLLVATLIAITSYAAEQPSDDYGEIAERARHQYWGFSVEPPSSLGWRIRRSEQAPVTALFRKDQPSFIFLGSLPSATHSFLVYAGLISLNPEETIEQFAQRQRRGRAGEGNPRHQLLAYEQQRESHQGLECIRFRIKTLDKAAPNSPNAPLHIDERGFSCIHPVLSRTVITALTSERGLPSELNEQLHKEGDHFLRSIQVESFPGVPVSSVTRQPHSRDIEIYRAEFGLFSRGGRGQPFFTPGTKVPLKEGQAYGWLIQVGTNQSKVKWREELTLPSAPQTWGNADKAKAPRLSDDRKTSVTEGEAEPTVGLISHSWRVAPGDPKGRYTIRLVLEDNLSRTFEFHVE